MSGWDLVRKLLPRKGHCGVGFNSRRPLTGIWTCRGEWEQYRRRRRGGRARGGGGCNHVKQEGGGEEGVGAKCCGYVLLKTEQDDGSVVSQQVTQDTYKDTYKDTFKDSYKDETMAPWYHRRQTFSKSTL